ncbi:MAG: TonB-dependent receptor [Alphaproteobacteria bacterium]|nr:TonB-dependent receptor [Alphaproteobacteria bacterium]
MTIGTRAKGRTALTTAVPVDVFNANAIGKAPTEDLNDALRTLVPSYNVNREPVNNGATFIRPAEMRGLPTDKVLVLVNGKRRHKSALVKLSGGGNRGGQGPDLATIPAAAVKSIEVLRDGAGAQYGSDAIAGVINFRLKNASDGGSLEARAGSTYKGDGNSIFVTGNSGFALGDKGFIDGTFEFVKSDPTSRGEQDPSSIARAKVDPAFAAAVDLSKPVQIYGAPNSKAIRFFVNSGYNITDNTSFYAFGNYASSKGDGDFYYRNIGGSIFTKVRNKTGKIVSFLGQFPAGFTPRFFGAVKDYSVVAGLKGDAGQLSWDVSSQYGADKIDYNIKNTVNPSFGPGSQTSFYLGSLKQAEFAANTDFVYSLPVEALASDLNIAFGSEYRNESYTIGSGEPASYQVGPYAHPDPFNFSITQAEANASATDNLTGPACLLPGLKTVGTPCPANDPVNAVLANIGANGFPGYPPSFSGKTSRNSYAAYIDVEADLTDRLMLDLAGRYEKYDGFGGNFNGKIAARYTVSDGLNVRASYGTGFHAPSVGQIGTTNVGTRIINGKPTAAGIFPANSPVSKLFGARNLVPERAKNYSVGFSWAPEGNFQLTVDYFRIELRNRISFSSEFALTDADRAALVKLGVAGGSNIGLVSFLTNDFSSRTQGVDVVALYDLESSLGNTKFQLSFNLTDTKITAANRNVDSNGNKIMVVNDEMRFDIENNQPKTRTIISVTHNFNDKWSVFTRATRWGKWAQSCCGNNPNIQRYGAKWLFDLNVSYQVSDAVRISAGANNIFNTYPDRDHVEFNGYTGQIYDLEAPFGFRGGSYYLDVKYDF